MTPEKEIAYLRKKVTEYVNAIGELQEINKQLGEALVALRKGADNLPKKADLGTFAAWVSMICRATLGE